MEGTRMVPLVAHVRGRIVDQVVIERRLADRLPRGVDRGVVVLWRFEVRLRLLEVLPGEGADIASDVGDGSLREVGVRASALQKQCKEVKGLGFVVPAKLLPRSTSQHSLRPTTRVHPSSLEGQRLPCDRGRSAVSKVRIDKISSDAEPDIC